MLNGCVTALLLHGYGILEALDRLHIGAHLTGDVQPHSVRALFSVVFCERWLQPMRGVLVLASRNYVHKLPKVGVELSDVSYRQQESLSASVRS